MHAFAAIDARAPSSALPQLLTRYMQGLIADKAWRQLMSLFDADAVTSEERMALARFVNDLLDEQGARTIYVPRPDEAQELLLETREAYP